MSAHDLRARAKGSRGLLRLAVRPAAKNSFTNGAVVVVPTRFADELQQAERAEWESRLGGDTTQIDSRPLNLRSNELALEGFGQLVVLKGDANVDGARAATGLVEIHRYTMLMVEPHSHLLVRIGEFPGLDV